MPYNLFPTWGRSRRHRELVMVSSIMTKNSFFCKHIQFKSRAQKPFPIWGQNCQNRYPTSDQNGSYSCITRIREYSPPALPAAAPELYLATHAGKMVKHCWLEDEWSCHSRQTGCHLPIILCFLGSDRLKSSFPVKLQSFEFVSYRVNYDSLKRVLYSISAQHGSFKTGTFVCNQLEF